MEIPSYTSNIQPYGYSGGTKVASDSTGVKNAVTDPTVSADTTPGQAPVQKENAVKVQETKPAEDIVQKRIEIIGVNWKRW